MRSSADVVRPKVCEQDNYAACVGDLPGYVATGETVEVVEEETRAAIRFHVEGPMADGLEVPQPTGIAE